MEIFQYCQGKPISHKKATNLPIPLDLPGRIHALTANESEYFIIHYNHDNPYVSSDDLLDASSVDTKSVGVETVDDDDDTSSDSEDSSSDDDSSNDNEIENSGMSDGRPSKEEVDATDKLRNEEQQGHFNMRGMRGNLPPPRASHRPGLS